jgi:hypothetical protein
MAVVELHPVRARRELVRERAAGLDDLEDAVHVRRVDAVEVDRVRMRAGVGQRDAQEVVLGRADHGTRHGAVVRPRREPDPRRDLDVAVARDERVGAYAARTVRLGRRRVEELIEVVRPADRGRALAEHGGVRRAVPLVALVHLVPGWSGLGPAAERELRERGGGDERRGAGEELPPTQPGFRHA